MAAHLGCFEWYNLKWDSFVCPNLDWSTFHNILKKNIDLPICMVAPTPAHRFRVIFHFKLVTCRCKRCDVWHSNHTSVGLTWGNILIVNRHCESYLRFNMFFILVFVISSRVYIFFSRKLSRVASLKAGSWGLSWEHILPRLILLIHL